MQPAPRIPRVRVRGIYATALTQWALDNGFQVVQASDVIAERLGIPQLPLPADATLKNGDDPGELVLVGYTWAAERILEKLRETLPYSFYWVSKLPLHATVKAESLGGCRARVAGVEAELAAEECPEPGTAIVAGVVRPAVKPGEKPRLAPGARVIGDYAIVYESPRPRVTISEHIRSTEKRAELAAIAAKATARGVSVHWRSSSRHATREQLEQHLDQLLQQLDETRKKAEQGEPGIHSEGETVAVVRLSRPDKEKLDQLRARAAPTAPLHHSVKSTDPEASIAIDYAEKLLQHGVEPEKLHSALLDLYAERLQQARRIKLLHIKPDGTAITIGPAEIKNIEHRGDRLIITLERTVRTSGTYDGIEAPKQPGDRIVTIIDTGEWTIIHRYYSPTGDHKGTYININTPPELSPTAIIYLDLEVDVAKKPGDKPRIIDKEKLEQAHRDGIITRKLLEKALQEAQKHIA